MYTIQNAVFPSFGLCSEELMYFRCQRSAYIRYDAKKLIIPQHGRVGTDTYFNSVSLEKWLKQTSIGPLSLQLQFKGRLLVRWYHAKTLADVEASSADKKNSCQGNLIGEQEIYGDTQLSVSIVVPQWGELTGGMLSFQLIALADSEVQGFTYQTDIDPANDVRLGIVITHFNRQQYLLPAVQRLHAELLTDVHYQDRVALYVVDNSQNLQQADLPSATIIPNANLGGSGGFTRGLMHVQDSGLYTHCLFMDDDASCEVESIRRVFAFLQYAKDSKTAVVGAMFLDRHPYMQYENGARFDGFCRPNNGGWDMRNVAHILLNEREQTIDYGGWWLYAFPLAHVQRLAFPFFVRGDDVGFGLSHDFHNLTLNGVASWQDDFVLKISPLVLYLDLRNHLVQNLTGLMGESSLRKATKVYKSFFKEYNSVYHYETAEILGDAVEDVMRGPQFWRDNVDMSKRRPELLAKVKHERLQMIDQATRAQFSPTPTPTVRKRGVKRLLLNGHLLPQWAFKKHDVLLPKAFWEQGIEQVYRRKRALFLYDETGQGYVLTHNKAYYFRNLWRYLCLRIQLRLRFKGLAREYQENYSELTSEAFWRQQFKKQ